MTYQKLCLATAVPILISCGSTILLVMAGMETREWKMYLFLFFKIIRYLWDSSFVYLICFPLIFTHLKNGVDGLPGQLIYSRTRPFDCRWRQRNSLGMLAWRCLIRSYCSSRRWLMWEIHQFIVSTIHWSNLTLAHFRKQGKAKYHGRWAVVISKYHREAKFNFCLRRICTIKLWFMTTDCWSMRYWHRRRIRCWGRSVSWGRALSRRRCASTVDRVSKSGTDRVYWTALSCGYDRPVRWRLGTYALSYIKRLEE